MFTPPRLLVLLALAFGLSSAPAADRVAFVIGVDAYDHLPKNAQLEVAVEDAERMAATLRKLDPPFDVTLLTDAIQDDAEKAYDEFLDAAAGAECALVYFAGHGIEYFGTNYLIVRDTAVDSESADVERMKRRLGNEALSLQAMVDSLDATGAKVKLVVLDCCRDNPLEAAKTSGTRSTLGGRSGLAQVTPPSGTLISYSADAGQKANDGLFTAVLIDQIENSGLPLPEVFASTRVKVREISTKWAAEDAAKGLPPEYRRVRHEPAEYVKLDPAAYRFRFSRGAPSEGKVEESPETVALRQQVEAMKKTIEELRKAGVENDALKEQVANMEATVAAGTKTPETPSAPTMVRTDPAPSGGFAASRSMEGSKAGEVREFGGIEMVWCPPGTFLMGSPEDEEGRGDDERQRMVTLTRGFWLAKTECTQEQWVAAMGNNPSYFRASDQLPVENVSWEDAQIWLSVMNDRSLLPAGSKWDLPSEAQWEYACRAKTLGRFSSGRFLSLLQANFQETSGFDGAGTSGKAVPNHIRSNLIGTGFPIGTSGDVSILSSNRDSLEGVELPLKPIGSDEVVTAAGSDTATGEFIKLLNDDSSLRATSSVELFQPNPWAIYGMHGNVAEWCRDYYGAYSGSESIDPEGPANGVSRIVRGGAWNSNSVACRSASREAVAPLTKNSGLGFRPAIVMDR